jgi:hypothetical protein
MNNEVLKMMEDQADLIVRLIKEQNVENERAMAAQQKLFEHSINFLRKQKGLPLIESLEENDTQ